MTRKSSKKRSGTSSPSELRDLPPIYLDESLSQRILSAALRARDLTVFIREEVFPAGVDDEVWLTRAGREGWIVFTKDKAIRRRDNERRALVNAGVRAFVLSAGALTGEEQATLFTRVIPKIRKYVAELTPPFIVRIEKSGAMEVLHPPPAPFSRR